jgi:hypothetical protein
MARRTKQLAQLVGFSICGDVAYARINGIFLNAFISDMDGNCMIRAYVKREGGVDAAGAEAFLDRRRDKYKTAKASFDGQSLNVAIPNYFKLTIRLIADFLSDFSMYLSSEGYRSACAFCETNEALGYTAQQDRVMEVCPACHERLYGIVSDMKKEREETGSYLRGTAGAVLGGIVGIIPWVILGFINYIAAASGLIMAFLSYKGYTLFKGKRGRGMLPIIIAVLLVFTYVAVTINQTITDYRYLSDEGLKVSALDLFGLELGAPFDPTLPDTGYLWAQLGLGWFFAALGGFFYLKSVRREGRGKDLEVKRIVQQ